MELIPAIDLRGGQVVRLLHGDFNAETRYATSPEGLHARYADWGAATLHVVDLDGARDGTSGNLAIIEVLSRSGRLKLQVGGGIRDEATLRRLFDLGVARAVVGSLAVTAPETVSDWLRTFGPERLTLALDVRLDASGTPRITTHGWKETTQLSLWAAVERYAAVGLRHVLCTDVARDGALAGPNETLYAKAVNRYPAIAWQASGGVRDVADLAALRAVGVAGTVSGKALLEGRMTREELQPYLPAA
jgi:phosphoribosylformimino-5-aminoimidazole carboxamide ribotide isomerase